jgi:hypothetical protein
VEQLFPAADVSLPAFDLIMFHGNIKYDWYYFEYAETVELT